LEVLADTPPSIPIGRITGNEISREEAARTPLEMVVVMVTSDNELNPLGKQNLHTLIFF
jgi:hypothetical protein